jgi:hypothetical protein
MHAACRLHDDEVGDEDDEDDVAEALRSGRDQRGDRVIVGVQRTALPS